MKKNVLFVSFLLVCFCACAQPAVSYLFSTSKTTPYVEISGGTLLGTKLDSNLLNAKILVSDTGYANNSCEIQKFKAIPLGFTFNFNGEARTHFLVNANGMVFLGGDSINGAYVNSINGNSCENLNNSIFCAPTTYTGEIRAMPPNAENTTSISYQSKESEGITSMIIQYKNLLYTNNIMASDVIYDTLSFQIIINSDHSFNFHFDRYRLNANIISAAQVGFRLDKNDYQLRGSTTSWDVTEPYIPGSSWDIPSQLTLSDTVFPTSGLMYAFLPPPPCIAPAQANTPTISAIKTNAAKLNLNEEDVQTDGILLVLAKKGTLVNITDGQIYKKDSMIGEAKVLSDNLTSEFFDIEQIEGSTQYTVFVYNYTNMCSHGPKYAQPATVDFTTCLSAPDLKTLGRNINAIQLKSFGNKDNDSILLCRVGVAVECELRIPANVKAGDTLNTGEIVLYRGPAAVLHEIKNLIPNTVYHFKAYSIAGSSQLSFSTTAAEVWDRTAATLPIRWDVSTFPLFDDLHPVPGFSSLLSTKWNQYRCIQPTDMFGSPNGPVNFEGTSNNNYEIMDVYPDSMDLILPAVLLESGQHRILFEKAFLTPPAFWGSPTAYRLTSSDSLCIQISLSDTLNSAFQTIGVINNQNYTDNTANFSKTIIPFTAYSNQIVYFRFVFYSKAKIINRLADFKIERVKDCEYPSFIGGIMDSSTSNSILVEWTDAEENASAWELQYREVGTEEWSMPIKANTNPYRIGDLPPITRFTVRVRTVCGASSISDWSEQSAVIQTAYAIPFFTNFKDVQYTQFPYGFVTYQGNNGPFLSDEAVSIADLNVSYSGDSWVGQSWRSDYNVTYPAVYTPFSAKTSAMISMPVLSIPEDDDDKYISFDLSINDPWALGLSTELDNTKLRISVLAIQDLANFSIRDTLVSFGKGSAYDLNTMDSLHVKLNISHLKGNVNFAFLVESDTNEGLNAGAYITNVKVDYQCPAPTQLASTQITDTTALVSWTFSEETDFVFAYKKSTETAYTYQRTSLKSVLLRNLIPASQYDIKVGAMCGMDTSQYAQAGFKTLSPYVCDTVTNLKAAIQINSATISWNGDASIYRFIWKKTSETNWDTISTNQTSLRLTNLEQASQYDYAVQAQCNDNPTDVSVFTSLRRFKTLDVTCHTPTDFKVAVLDWNLVGFTYNTMDAVAVDLYIGQVEGSGEIYNYGLYDTLTLVGLEPETAYFAKLRSSCGGNDVSGYTDSIIFTTPSISPCYPPTALVSNIVNDKSAQLSWNHQGQIAWNLVYKEGSSAWDTVRALTEPKYILENLKPNIVYSWKVQGACSEYLVSRYSEVASFTNTGIEDGTSDLEQFTVFGKQKQIHISNPNAAIIDKLDIYTVQGQLIQAHKVRSNGNIILPIELENALIIVNIYSKGKLYVYKTMIR